MAAKALKAWNNPRLLFFNLVCYNIENSIHMKFNKLTINNYGK